MGLYLDEANIRAILSDITFAMYKGVPVYIYRKYPNSGYGNYTYHVAKIGAQPVDSDPLVDLKEPTLSLSSVPLGFVNTLHHTTYVVGNAGGSNLGMSGVTARWTSNVTNSVYSYDGDDYDSPASNTRYLYHDSKELGDCVNNVYPTFKEALAKLNKRAANKGCAFHRHYALSKRKFGDIYSVMFKDRCIGSLDPDTGRFNIDRSPISKIFVKKLKELAGDDHA